MTGACDGCTRMGQTGCTAHEENVKRLQWLHEVGQSARRHDVDDNGKLFRLEPLRPRAKSIKVKKNAERKEQWAT